MDEPTTSQLMGRLAEQAAAQARKSFSAKLDFTPKSIQTLDIYIGEIHFFLKSPSNTWTSETIQSHALSFGAYLGEVIKRNHGGDWVMGSVQKPRFTIANVTLYPADKVLKRLTNGLEDNLVQYYDALTKAMVPAVAGPLIPNPTLKPERLEQADWVSLSYSSGEYSVSVPPSWRSYEKNSRLSAYPAGGELLVSFHGNKGWIAFDELFRINTTLKNQELRQIGVPYDIDGVNCVGRCLELQKTTKSKIQYMLIYCLQSPVFMLTANVFSQSPIVPESREMCDSIVRSVEMRT